jgi:hypothetical protein
MIIYYDDYYCDDDGDDDDDDDNYDDYIYIYIIYILYILYIYGKTVCPKNVASQMHFVTILPIQTDIHS